MTEIPPPAGPLDYSVPSIPPPNPRPTSVTVVAIIAIIFGSLGVLGGLCSIPQYIGVQIGPPNPVMQGVHNDPILFSITLVNLVVGVLVAIVGLWAGIGMLSLKPAARTGIIWYAIAYLATGIIGLVLNVAIVQPRMQKITQDAMGNNPQMNNPAVQSIMRYTALGGVCIGVLVLVWPIIILYFMNKPHVKAAFGQGGDDALPPGGTL